MSKKSAYILRHLSPGLPLSQNGLSNMNAVEEWGAQNNLSAAQTSAILGSVQQESSGLTAGTNHNWLGWSNPQGTEADHSHDTSNVGKYLTNFVNHEGKPSAPQAFETFKTKFKNASPEACSKYWGHMIEACGQMGSRTKFARQYYNQITKADPGDVYGASAYAKAQPKKSLYVHSAHVKTDKSGNVSVYVTPKYRNDVKANGSQRGKYVLNPEKNGKHTQKLSLQQFNAIMKDNHRPPLSKAMALKVAKSGRQLANTTDGLTFKANVFGKNHHFDPTTVQASQKQFNYVDQLSAKQLKTLTNHYEKNEKTQTSQATQNSNLSQSGQSSNITSASNPIAPTNKQLNQFARQNQSAKLPSTKQQRLAKSQVKAQAKSRTRSKAKKTKPKVKSATKSIYR